MLCILYLKMQFLVMMQHVYMDEVQGQVCFTPQNTTSDFLGTSYCSSSANNPAAVMYKEHRFRIRATRNKDIFLLRFQEEIGFPSGSWTPICFHCLMLVGRMCFMTCRWTTMREYKLHLHFNPSRAGCVLQMFNGNSMFDLAACNARVISKCMF